MIPDSIWDLIIDLIRSCLDQDKESIREQLRHPNIRQRRLFEFRVRRTLGYRFREWRRLRRDEIMPQIYAQAEAATDEELDVFIDDAKD